jgi:hypothetical protein
MAIVATFIYDLAETSSTEMTKSDVDQLEKELLSASLAQLPRRFTLERYGEIADKALLLCDTASRSADPTLIRRLRFVHQKACIHHARLC